MRIVAVLVIVSRTVQNWRPFRANRRPISADEIILRATRPIGNQSKYRWVHSEIPVDTKEARLGPTKGQLEVRLKQQDTTDTDYYSTKNTILTTQNGWKT